MTPETKNRTAPVPLPMQLVIEAFELDPSSPSWLRWRIRPREHFKSDRGWRIFNSRHAGKPVTAYTSLADTQYWVVRFGGRLHRAHRLVLALVSGSDPGPLHVDHIDGNGLNNNPANLRMATHQENLRNRGPQKNNTTGRKGVSWNKHAQKYVAQIKINGRPIHLGCFVDIESASAAYETAALSHFGAFCPGRPSH